MAWTEALGFIAGFLTTFSAFPQLYYSYRSRDVKSIQVRFLWMLMSGLFLWGIYGILLGSLPIILFNFTAFLLWVPILWMKIKEIGII